ncbi:MAG: recombinase family protein [Candidatus Caccovivens sp.]
MKTAVIYARYSSDNQTEQSIDGQLRVCQEYAQRNDILILDTYIDRAMTGTNDNRPDFQRMIKDSSKKEWNYVLVYKIDRFSRNKYETAKNKKILKDNGVKLLSAMENIPDTPEGIILESLLEGMAEYYSAELAQKVKRGMHETRLKGNFQGGTLPYGYKVDGRKIVIDETKAEIVKYIFNQYSKGIFVNEIIRNLTSKGILHNSKPFQENMIYHILKNEKYTGIYRKDGEVFENMYPQIIDKDLFDSAKSKRKVNHYGKNAVKTIYLLRNKLVCGYCGKPISAEKGTSKNGKPVSYYKCKGIKKYRNGCVKETIRQDILEEFILDTIITELHKESIMNKIVRNLFEMQSNPNNNSALNILAKSKKQAETALNNILTAIEQGVINKTTNARMKELEQQIEDLESQMLIERSKMNAKISEEEIRKFYTDALKQEPMMLINYLIKQIKMFNERIEITFNSPTLRGPNTDFSFLTINKPMRKILPHKQFKLIYIEIEFYI